MPHHQQVHAARCNGSGDRWEHWFGEVLGAAEKGRHPGLRRAANELLAVMAHKRWRVMPGPKHGGTGSAAGRNDTGLHVTILFQGDRACHLRLDAKHHVFEISRGDAAPEVRGWQGPGTPNG
jgi:hypothetical protein